MKKSIVNVNPYNLRTAFTFKTGVDDLEKVRGKSQTVQGDGYSIKDLVERAKYGGIVPESTEGSYPAHDPRFDDDLSMETAVDITEIEESIRYKTAAEIADKKEPEKKEPETKKEDDKEDDTESDVT